MAPKKHEVDPVNQGAFFPPEREGAAALGGLTAVIEGGYYREARALQPSLEAPLISPVRQAEIDRLQAECDALDNLALENRSGGNVTHKTNQANRLNATAVDAGNEIVELRGKVEKSEQALTGLRLASKGSLAQAMGIEVSTELVDKVDDFGKPVKDGKGNVVKIPKIMAKDPQEQARLDLAYRHFRAQYFGTRNRRNLVSRRAQLKAEIHKTKGSA
jgi:hypothetical protein